MPIYVYHCAACDTHLEKRQGFADAPLTACEHCGGSVRRVLQPVGVIFKGSGFYSTDYRAGAAKGRDSANGEKAASATENGSGGSAEKSTAGGDKASSAAQPAGSAAKSE